MIIIQCINSSYIDPYLVSVQSMIDSNIRHEHILFSYSDIKLPHVKLERPPTEQNNTPFDDKTFQGMVMRLYALDWLIENGYENERILYLDCDILVQSNLSELVEVDIGDNWIAASPENHSKYFKESIYEMKYPEEEARRNELNKQYFNSGVLLIDLPKYLKKFNKKFTENMDLSGYIYPDQDYLNAMAVPYAIMPRRYNCLPEMRISDLLETEHLIDIQRDMRNSSIMHFAGMIKPDTIIDAPFEYYGLQIPYDLYYKTAIKLKGKISDSFLERVKHNYEQYKTTFEIIKPFL